MWCYGLRQGGVQNGGPQWPPHGGWPPAIAPPANSRHAQIPEIRCAARLPPLGFEPSSIEIWLATEDPPGIDPGHAKIPWNAPGAIWSDSRPFFGTIVRATGWFPGSFQPAELTNQNFIVSQSFEHAGRQPRLVTDFLSNSCTKWLLSKSILADCHPQVLLLVLFVTNVHYQNVETVLILRLCNVFFTPSVNRRSLIQFGCLNGSVPFARSKAEILQFCPFQQNH